MTGETASMGSSTMNNRVVYQIYHAFVDRGFSALRFNFRGVGRSQGTFDHGIGELSDAAAALDWMQSFNPNATGCWIAGFSFGAWIGMQLLMRRPEIEGFISIAPPANLHDFSFLAPCPSSGLIVHGDKHRLIIDQPLTISKSESLPLEMATRLQVMGAEQIDAIAITVDPATPALYSFRRLLG